MLVTSGPAVVPVSFLSVQLTPEGVDLTTAW